MSYRTKKTNDVLSLLSDQEVFFYKTYIIHIFLVIRLIREQIKFLGRFYKSYTILILPHAYTR